MLLRGNLEESFYMERKVEDFRRNVPHIWSNGERLLPFDCKGVVLAVLGVRQCQPELPLELGVEQVVIRLHACREPWIADEIHIRAHNQSGHCERSEISMRAPCVKVPVISAKAQAPYPKIAEDIQPKRLFVELSDVTEVVFSTERGLSTSRTGVPPRPCRSQLPTGNCSQGLQAAEGDR